MQECGDCLLVEYAWKGCLGYENCARQQEVDIDARIQWYYSKLRRVLRLDLSLCEHIIAAKPQLISSPNPSQSLQRHIMHPRNLRSMISRCAAGFPTSRMFHPIHTKSSCHLLVLIVRGTFLLTIFGSLLSLLLCIINPLGISIR